MTRRRLLPLALLALLGVLAACRPADAGHESEREAERPVAGVVAPALTLPVRVVAPEAGSLEAVRSASVTLRPERESLVASGASARVSEVLRRPGARVEPGELVVRLDDEGARLGIENARVALASARINLSAAERAAQDGTPGREAQLRSARVSLELARRQLGEAQALAAVGGVAQGELQRLEAQVAQAESGFSAAQEGVSRAARVGDEDLALLRLQVEQAQNGLAQAERALAETRVTAPFAGEVVELMVEVGEFVGAGGPVFRLASSESPLVRVRLPPEDAGRLPLGSEVTVIYAGRSYGAEVTRSAAVPGQDRLVELTAALRNGALPAGAVARLEYGFTLAEGLLLPAAALRVERGEPVVYEVIGGRAQRVPVQVLAEHAGQAAVSGLTADALVIHPLPAGLLDGAEVEVVGS